jgi:hypothetical protein
MEPICPQCHVVVRASDFFCYNCGKNLKPKLLSTGLATEIMYYVGSFLLPPLGYWWGIRYLKQDGAAGKRIGILCMIFTTISCIVTSIWVAEYVNKLNAAVGSQLNSLEGF